MPRISLIAPVYGVEKYIHQFLDSIRKQSFKDFEVILVDDGSKDNCPLILDQYARQDSRCKVIHQANGGVSAARNTAIEHITGEYVYIVDSDDWLEETALEKLWQEAERTGADLIYGDVVQEGSRSVRIKCFDHPFVTTDQETIKTLQFAVNSNSYTIGIRRPEFSRIRCFGGAPWRAMIKSAIIQDNRLKFDPYVLGLGDDILFMLHVYEFVKCVAYIPEKIYHYRLLENSYSHGFKKNYLQNLERIFEKHEEYLKMYNKDEFMRTSFYLRVMLYLNEGMHRYFKNQANPEDESARYKRFLCVMSSEPYNRAKGSVPIHYLRSPAMVLKLLCLKYGFYRLFWRIA